MKIRNKDIAIKLFIKSSINQMKDTEEGAFKTGNKNYYQIISAAKYLKENNNLNELENLLIQEEIGVKLWAATFLLEKSEKMAKKALTEIIEMNISHHSFTAEMTLEEWNSGNLKLQF